MISLRNLEKSHGDRVLFKDVNIVLDPAYSYGIVGANGSGKSSLLRLIVGLELPTEGSIDIPKRTTVGILDQHLRIDDDVTVLDAAMAGDADRFAALNQEEGTGDLDERSVHRLPAETAEILDGVGVPAAMHVRTFATLSGGQKVRVLLARLLVSAPDYLLLDEPTNHLDIVSIRWLEAFLTRRTGVVVVSHDRRFLQAVAQRTLDVDFATITHYKQRYDRFVDERALVVEQRQKEIDKRQAEIDRHRQFIERFSAKATKARQAQSKKKQLEKIEIEPLPTSTRRAPHISLRASEPSGRDVLTTDGLAKQYDDTPIFADVGFRLSRGDRLGIVGPNGIGKSTLLSILADKLDATAGEFQWGHQVHLGVWPQEPKAVLGRHGDVLSATWEADPTANETQVRGALGAVLFSGDDVKTSLSAISGGEAARVVMARLALSRHNTLLVDEPTNHLDMEAIEALSNALIAYDGTIIFVSHNRWFLSRVATRILEMTSSGIDNFPGTYDEFVAHKGDDYLVDTPSNDTQERPSSTSDNQTTRLERKALQKELRKLERDIDKITTTIEKTETRQAELNARFCQADFYSTTSPDEVEALQKEHDELAARAETLWQELEAAETRAEEIRGSL